MEKINVRKNVFLGCCVLDFIVALLMLVTDKTQTDLDAKKAYVTSIVFTIAFAICGVIPFLGWILSIPVLVFYIIAVVNFFKGNYEYNVPVFGGIIAKYVK